MTLSTYKLKSGPHLARLRGRRHSRRRACVRTELRYYAATLEGMTSATCYFALFLFCF